VCTAAAGSFRLLIVIRWSWYVVSSTGSIELTKHWSGCTARWTLVICSPVMSESCQHLASNRVCRERPGNWCFDTVDWCRACKYRLPKSQMFAFGRRGVILSNSWNRPVTQRSKVIVVVLIVVVVSSSSSGGVFRSSRSNSVPQKIPMIFSCNLSKHCLILVIFYRKITVKLDSLKLDYFPPSADGKLASVKHVIRGSFHSKCCFASLKPVLCDFSTRVELPLTFLLLYDSVML